MSKSYHFTFPLNEEQIRELQLGDLVYLTGNIYTMRDMGHRRAVDMLNEGKELPFDLASGAIWHCGPIVRKDANDKWETVSAGSTTSSRFTYLGSDLIKKVKLRATIGKGQMLQTAVDTMQEVGSVFLNTTGGTAALYAQQIEEIVDVHWTDLGLPEAIWVMRVKDLGPLVVGIDSHGRSLFNDKKIEMDQLLAQTYKDAKIDPTYNLAYLPKRVPASGTKK
ncbi:MAG: FumA C-terminus/TtdB family hydratase beta subunit [Peptococcaceae bacterium]|jgi:fumarate hydratase subunit beta|nr:FumA C-terminus/TtdB family hydratase beta subunit [Peptococcaceae bacterium]